MRILLPLLVMSLAAGARAQIHDVLKSAEIDGLLAHATGDRTLHERPHYSLSLLVRDGKPGPSETHADADEIIVVRRGSAAVALGPERLSAGAGDIVKISRGTPHTINPGGSRFEALALRISAESAGVRPRTGIRPAEHQMPGLLKKSEIDATFAKFDSNQPIHSAPNFTMNYVIYAGHAGPWEAHAGCVDIYFMQIGSAAAQIGGVIRNAKEDVPGEPRGDGVSGARRHAVGPGDVVLIPRDTTHHMEPAAGKLGYVLVKVWVD